MRRGAQIDTSGTGSVTGLMQRVREAIEVGPDEARTQLLTGVE
jgi:hypothetical protein